METELEVRSSAPLSFEERLSSLEPDDEIEKELAQLKQKGTAAKGEQGNSATDKSKDAQSK